MKVIQSMLTLFIGLQRNVVDGRQKWIKYEWPPALEVLETFPPLRQSKHVSMHIYHYVYHSQLFCQLHSLQLQTELIRVAGDGTQLGLAEDKWKEFQSKTYKQASIEAQSSAMFKTLLLNQDIEAKSAEGYSEGKHVYCTCL